MRIFKTTYKDKDGNTKKCRTWYIEFQDHQGRTRRVAGDKSRDVANYYMGQIKSLVHAKKQNLRPDKELVQWAREIPDKLRCRLLAIGVIDTGILEEDKPLSEYLEDYRLKLKAGFKPKLQSGNTRHHVRTVSNQVEKIIKGCQFVNWSDIDYDKVHQFIISLGLADRTYNGHVGAFKQFCNWLMDKYPSWHKPSGSLPVTRQERRRVRRVLEHDEVAVLLESTVQQPKMFGVTGYDRAVMYLLALETGLRSKELQHLTPDCFDFANGYVVLAKEYTKNRETAEIPLKQCRIKLLREFVKDGDRLFKVWRNHNTAKMIQKDIEVAGLSVADDTGLPATFHSLRDGFCTALDHTTASLAERMTLARHSMRSSLTLGVYTHVKAHNLKKIIEQLPHYNWPGTQENRKLNLA